MNLGKNCLILTAHPDDETLWCGGLVSSYFAMSQTAFTCICCSIPRRKTELWRAFEFFNACRILKIFPKLIPQVEMDPGQDLPIPLPLMELRQYDSVITHNAEGEYGHLHHKNVHNFVKNYARPPIYTFGYGKGNIEILLAEEAYQNKMHALQAYKTHTGPEEKFLALKKRYPICAEKRETFNDFN